MDESSSAAPPVKLRRSVEDRAIETYITIAGTLLDKIRLSTSLAERLAGYGFDDEELTVGAQLQDAAWHSFQKRVGASPPEHTSRLDLLNGKMKRSREKFTEFRGVARAAFPGLSDRINLGVTGDLPDDLQRFLTHAHAAYTAASTEPYIEKLSKRSYPPACLASLLQDLDSLATLDVAHELALDDAEEEEDRESSADDTYQDLKEFMKELKGVIRTVYRKEPRVLEQLELD